MEGFAIKKQKGTAGFIPLAILTLSDFVAQTAIEISYLS